MDGLTARLNWFKAVILPHEAALRSRQRRVGPMGFDVDNLVAESLARAYTAKDIDRIPTGRGYLFTIARNLLIDTLRRETIVQGPQPRRVGARRAWTIYPGGGGGAPL